MWRYCEVSATEGNPLPSALLKKVRLIQSWYSPQIISCIWSARFKIKFYVKVCAHSPKYYLNDLAEDIPLCLKYSIKMKRNMYSACHNYLFILWLWQTEYIFYFVLILSKWFRLLRRWNLYTEGLKRWPISANIVRRKKKLHLVVTAVFLLKAFVT